MTTSQTLVDCHFHVFDAGVAVASARYRPPYAAPLADWLAMAGALGDPAVDPVDAVDPYGVVVQTSFLGTDNSAMLAALGRMPGRLRGVAVVDPAVNDAELATLDAAGVRGIRLNLYGDAGWRRIDTAPWRTLFQRVAALGWHVELHTNNGDGATVLAALDIAMGETSAPIVLDHFGRPGPLGVDDPVFDTARTVAVRRPLWIKISAPYRLASPNQWPALAAHWAEVAGPDRLLWGSDWPWTNHEAPARADECRAVMAWFAQRPDLTEGLRWRNAAALYGFALAG
ncbi:2-pyrone-4,6-dicarbaxylate hydrolase [compost metagenome]|uniref:Hydrolase n=1 Tax=Cupriavidus campinensis TaxID=151783 RepID=A0ABY3EMV1_9BURK|nr:MULTISPECIES: amidohydrolase family protein [Cupriavidus]TSP12184.1 hydrolase [Cupriavidus campinensis]CAG2129295.1 2-pyrone-4,6-dicarboxylate hydrolase [Cupriavidus campinensis]